EHFLRRRPLILERLRSLRRFLLDGLPFARQGVTGFPRPRLDKAVGQFVVGNLATLQAEPGSLQPLLGTDEYCLVAAHDCEQTHRGVLSLELRTSSSIAE